MAVLALDTLETAHVRDTLGIILVLQVDARHLGSAEVAPRRDSTHLEDTGAGLAHRGEEEAALLPEDADRQADTGAVPHRLPRDTAHPDGLESEPLLPRNHQSVALACSTSLRPGKPQLLPTTVLRLSHRPDPRSRLTTRPAGWSSETSLLTSKSISANLHCFTTTTTRSKAASRHLLSPYLHDGTPMPIESPRYPG